MANKPIIYQPLQMPSLSQSPDPVRDLMGGTGLTNPVSLMTMNQQDIDNLYSPKPATVNSIRPSATAARALQDAQRQAQAQVDEFDKLQKQQLEFIEEQKRERERKIKENLKIAEQLRKEQEKAQSDKKEQQGGKLGAAPDGSFVLPNNINEVLRSQEWNSVVSDKQRIDRAEAYLAQYATDLRAMGATEEQIAAEIENGRNIFKAHTDAYTKSMREDGQGLFDLTVAPAAKTGAFIFNATGVLSKLVGADTVGDFLLERGKTATDAAHDFESTSIKLDRANSAYDEQKFDEANPNANWRDGGVIGTAHGMAAAVKRAWDNNTLDNFIAEQVPQLLLTLGAGGVGAKAGTAVAKSVGKTALASNKPVATALSVLSGTYKTKSGVTQLGANALSGAGLGVGAYGFTATVGDAGAGAWEQVKSTSFEDIKKTYGAKKWADAVALHGSEEKARDVLASEALERAVGKVAPVAAVTSFLGVESTFAALLTRQAVKEEAKKFTAKSIAKGVGSTTLSAVEEGVEEGYTQYSSNVGATEFTGVDVMAGVSSAAGLGAFIGGAATAVTNTLSAAKNESNVTPNDFAKSFVEQGYFDDKAFRQDFERKMDWYSRDGQKKGVSMNEIHGHQQTHFNEYIDYAYTVTREDGSTDTKSIWDLMTPEQAQSFKDYVRLNYGINTNNYARHQDTIEYDAIKNDNMEVLSRPENADLLNVWRILNNTDTDQIPADKRDYYTAIAEVTNYLRPTETTHNTHEREQLFDEFWNTQLDNRGFDAIQRTGITEFARTILGANSRRFNDEEQQAWNEWVAQQGQNNGINEQNQTDISQPSGQRPIDENAESVATQGGGTGTSQATTLRQAAEELANAFSGRPASSDTQSVGDGNPRQGTNASSQANSSTTNGAGVTQPNAGVGQAQTTGDTVNPTTPEVHSGATAQSGNFGQTNRGGQSFGQTIAPTTQTTTSGGGVGTPQAERYSNGGSNQALTKADIKNHLLTNGADPSVLTIEVVKHIIALRKNNKLVVPYNLFNATGTAAKNAEFNTAVKNATGGVSQFHAVQYIATLSNEQFNSDVGSDMFKYGQPTNRLKKLRVAVLSALAEIEYNAHLEPMRQERERQALAEREQKAQARAEEKVRQQQAQAEQKAETDRIKAQQEAEKEQARVQKKIDSAELANVKAQQVLRDKQATLREKELVHIELKDSRAELVSQLDEAKLTRKESKETVREYERRVKNANTAVDRADKAWRIELEKTKRKELKEQLTVEKNAATTVKNELTKAIKALEVADKSVNDLNEKIKALDVKIKKAKQVVAGANREVVSARTAADKTQAKLDALQSIQADEKLAPDTADNDLQDVDEADTADTVDENPQVAVEQTADDAETVEQTEESAKPKRGGRSKKKTTNQLDLFEQNKSNTEVSNLIEKQMNALYSFAKELGLKGPLKKSGEFIPARAEEALSNLRELATTNPQRLETLINSVGLKTRRVGVEYAQILRDLAQLTPQEQISVDEQNQTELVSLPPHLAEYVRTPEFKSWFGDWENDPQNASKVVDKNGEPLLVYRGVRPNKTNDKPYDGLYYFTDNADSYFFSRDGEWVVTSGFLNIRNPKSLDMGTIEFLSNNKQVLDPNNDGYIYYGDPNARSQDIKDMQLVVESADRFKAVGQQTYNTQLQERYELVIFKPNGSEDVLSEEIHSSSDAAYDRINELNETGIDYDDMQVNKLDPRPVTTKYNSINLLEREQTNAEENDLGQSVQSSTEQAQDENQTDIVGVNNTTDDEQGEVFGQSRQLDNNQSQGSGIETTQDTEQLGVEPLLERVTDRQISVSYRNARLTPEEKKAIGTGKASIPNIKEMLTTPQTNLTDIQISALNKLADYIRSGKTEAKTKTAPTDSHAKQVASKQSEDVIANVLDSNPDLVEKAEQSLDEIGLDVSVEEFVRDVLSADFTSRDVEAILNNPNKYKKQFDNAKSVDTTDEINYEKAKKDYITISSQSGAIDPAFLFALPTALFNAIRVVWNAIKNNFAKVSLAIAVSTGTTLAIPTEANAATPTETAVVQNIISQNDNQGKQFIVADKQAGTLTLYNALGQQITSTPALFGKATGDRINIRNATPSGRYDMKRVEGSNIKGNEQGQYGNSAQALTVNGELQKNNAGNVAIHRVLPVENRQAKLDSATAKDNRISHGCINVPSSFYDIHLDHQQDTVVYVMPETNAGRTGVFDVAGTNTLPQSETSTTTHTIAKEQVEPEFDKANSQSVEVTPEQLTNATPYDRVKTAPKIAQAPLIIKGAEQSTQVAYTTPTVLGDENGKTPITADRIVTPKIDGKVVHTPAEQRADTSFDTEPVKNKTDDGVSLAEVAVGLAAAFAGGMYMNRRRERAKAKKLQSKKRSTVVDNPPDDSTPTPNPTPNMPKDPPTTEQVQDTINTEHNEQVNKSANNAKSIPKDIKVPSQPTATALAVNREMWIKYLIETNQLGHTGSQEMADMLLNTLRAFEYSSLAIMTDLSYQQANDGTFDGHRVWGDGEVNTDRTGVFNKFISIAAGAAPIFDNYMGKLGIARGGHEADSSLASIALAQVKSKALGANAQIYKFFVGPMLERTKLLAQELRRGDEEVELATGRVATANHVLNEAADAMWKGFEAELAHLQDSLAKVNADLAANPSNKDYPLRTMNTAKKLEDEIRQVSELYTRTRNMYEGKTAWDGDTKLPGGMTKAHAEQDIADVKAEYGADYAKIEENVKELVKTIRGIRQFATAAGVFTNEDIEVFNELGFDGYVPLYAEERDPTDMNEEDNYTRLSTMDRLMQGIPLIQARSMGLTKDLSRYRRKGATSPAADGFTNMKKFAMNMAGRVGQQNWVEMTQQLYEGTVGKPYSTANITDPDELADLNSSYDSGKVPGLIRVRPGMKDFLPTDIKAKIDKVRPIIGKGSNANGDTVAFEYYWTEPAIQAEIYANTDLSDTLTKDWLRNIGTATRVAARLVTVGKPMWNIYNHVRDSFERVSIMLMRPVKDRNGNLVPKWKLTMEFFKVLPMLAINAKDIYRYLVLGEVKTPIQTMLNEAVGEGAINLMTTQTEKHSVIGDLKKSSLERAGNKIGKWLGDTANKTGTGVVRNAMTKSFDFYIVAMTEIPQVSTALASYIAYQNVGVNKKESANRVRDAYDPNRTNNEIIHNIGQFHPFVRSAFSGHYNLTRSLTQYWKPGEWQFTLAYTLGGTLGVIGLLSMLAGAFDDDDDGRSALARLPLSILTGGIPIPWGENGVWIFPVGFGLNKLIWGIGTNLYRYFNGYQSAGETAMGLVGLFVDNTSPIQTASGSSLAENPTAAAVLTATPMLIKPIVEMGFNTKAYGGGKVWNKDTPRDQLDSQQDNFNTPETYKKWAMWLNESGFGDYRPETVQHLFESYGNLAGPLSAIPQSVIADQSEKTLGNKERKGEVFGATLTALGAGMSIQPNALDIANLTYEMNARRYELHRKYGVGESHTEEQYEQYAQRGKRGAVLKDAKYVTEVRLREKGVPEEHIKYIVNTMKYQSKREKLDKEFKDLALEYNRLVASGKEDLQMRQAVQDSWDALEELTNNYVKENNNVFFTLR